MGSWEELDGADRQHLKREYQRVAQEDSNGVARALSHETRLKVGILLAVAYFTLGGGGWDPHLG